MARLGVWVLAAATLFAALCGPVGFIIVGAYINLPSPQYEVSLAALFLLWVAAPIAGLVVAWLQRSRGHGRMALILAAALAAMLFGQAMIENLPMRAV